MIAKSRLFGLVLVLVVLAVYGACLVALPLAAGLVVLAARTGGAVHGPRSSSTSTSAAA